MPRTRRYIFNMLTVVSLVMLLGMASLWLRSHYVSDFFEGYGQAVDASDEVSNDPSGPMLIPYGQDLSRRTRTFTGIAIQSVPGSVRLS
jgi:hypothetical protein